MKRKPNCKCNNCGKEIYRRPSQLEGKSKVYCSSECHGVGTRKVKICPVCSDEFTGVKKTCSRACANKGRLGTKYFQGRTKDQAYIGKKIKEDLSVVRGRVCESCGYDNYNILQVHHITERANGGTDVQDNLALLCPNCHFTIHYGDSRRDKPKDPG